MSIYTKPSADLNVRHNVFERTSQGDFLGAFSLVVAAAPQVDDDPGLWDFLARRFAAHGAEGPAEQAQELMWDAGFRSAPMALALARAANDRGDPTSAACMIREQFGELPVDPPARLQLARAIGDTAPRAAADLLDGQTFERAEEAVFYIDLLRIQDRFAEALAVCGAQAPRFPGDERFGVRVARIAEARHRWEDALAGWQSVGDSLGAVAEVQIVRLLLRLERVEEAEARAAALYLEDLPRYLRHQLALALGDDAMAGAALHRAWLDHGPKPDDDSPWIVQDRQIMNGGHAALLIWADARGLAMPAEYSATLLRAFPDEMRRRIAAMPFDAAYRLDSPSLFLDEFDDLIAPPEPALGVAPPPAVAAATAEAEREAAEAGPVVLVNATLASGGAERQLVTLVRALLGAGLPADRLHCAFFSLSEERGHAHFLPELQSLGVQIHDLRRRRPSYLLAMTRAGAVVGAMPGALREDIVRLDALVEELNPSVIHGWQDRASVAAGWVGLTRQVPRIVSSMRNMQPSQRGQRQRYLGDVYRAYMTTGRVKMTANSIAGSRDYETWLGLDRGQVATLTNGLALDGVPVAGPACADVLDMPGFALCVGGVFRLAANKRPLLWFETVAALGRRLGRPMSARIVGRGPFEAALRDAAVARPETIFTLDQGLSSVTDIYDGFDILLLMSRVEGLPNVLIEAQALGLPVAACDVGGVREAVLADGPGAALILPPEITPDEAAERIAGWLPGALAADPRLRRQFVDRTFGLGVLGRRTAALYRGEAA